LLKYFEFRFCVQVNLNPQSDGKVPDQNASIGQEEIIQGTKNFMKNKGFVLRCSFRRRGKDQEIVWCENHAEEPVQLGGSYVMFCKGCICRPANDKPTAKIDDKPRAKIEEMETGDLPPTCRFKDCYAKGACYLNSNSELVGAFLRANTDKITIPKQPDWECIESTDDPPCCTSKKENKTASRRPEGDKKPAPLSVSLCLKHASEVDKYILEEDWPLESVDRNVLCRKHAVDELADEVALRAELLILDEWEKSRRPAPAHQGRDRGSVKQRQKVAPTSPAQARDPASETEANLLNKPLREGLMDLLGNKNQYAAEAVEEWLESVESELKQASVEMMLDPEFTVPSEKGDSVVRRGREWYQDKVTWNAVTDRVVTTVIGKKVKKGDLSLQVSSRNKPLLLLEGRDTKPVSPPPRSESAFKYSAAIKWFRTKHANEGILQAKSGPKREATFKYERHCDIKGCHDTAKYGILQQRMVDNEELFHIRFCQKHAVFGSTIAQHYNIKFPRFPCFQVNKRCLPVLANPQICEYPDCKDLAVHNNELCDEHLNTRKRLATKLEMWQMKKPKGNEAKGQQQDKNAVRTQDTEEDKKHKRPFEGFNSLQGTENAQEGITRARDKLKAPFESLIQSVKAHFAPSMANGYEQDRKKIGDSVRALEDLKALDGHGNSVQKFEKAIDDLKKSLKETSSGEPRNTETQTISKLQTECRQALEYAAALGKTVSRPKSLQEAVTKEQARSIREISRWESMLEKLGVGAQVGTGADSKYLENLGADVDTLISTEDQKIVETAIATEAGDTVGDGQKRMDPAALGRMLGKMLESSNPFQK
jgi:hypothetical protein